MTPTWPSTAAGTEPATADRARAANSALICGWLRRSRHEPAAQAWVLRGSIVIAAQCAGARVPGDVDYLLEGGATRFDAAAIERAVRSLCARSDEHDGDATSLRVECCEVIWGETASPGLRVSLSGDVGAVRDHRLQVDLAVGDPMCVPPRRLAISGVGDVLACALETLFGWKLHGLAEFGRGKWRAKDLYDLDVLWREAHLDRPATRAAVELAFSSRALPLSALHDFRMRPTWGQSLGGNRKWRALRKAHPQITDDQSATRDRVRAALDELLGPPLSPG
ncbi:MAG TPA: nucleotidyl transferase AbiEii/AbiGii toxin family protein [Kofleriaceae bacterium]|nr:nucleotidyl transferase AbiEii/AbiGii toxin family protein [Kofleriaceae bacterium]